MKRGWVVIIVAVAIVALLGSAVYVFLLPSPPDQNQDKPLFKNGDWLNYTLSGLNKGGSPIVGKMNISISNVSSSGLSYQSLALWNNSRDPFGTFSFQFVPGVGQWVKESKIPTAIGDKFVRTYLDYRVRGLGELMLISVGAESGLVYQMIVCSPEYRYEINMSNSSSVRLHGLDQHGSSNVSVGSARVSTEHPTYTYDNGTGGTGLGSLEVMEGERLRYEVTGSNVTFYLFSMGNIDSMLGGGQFEFDQLHSMQRGLHGVFDYEIQAGTYWYVFQVDPAPEHQVVVRYWG